MNTMLTTAQAAIRQAATALGYDEKTIEAILEAEAEHIFEVEVAGKAYPAYRVQHSSKLGPYKGGIRFHPGVTLDEVRALATLMSIKTAAIGLPLGGGKGGVAVDPRSLTQQEIETLSRSYARQLAPHIGSNKDIPAPDVNTNADIMAWMVDEFEKTMATADPGSFTGKPLGKGGSAGREAATGRGGVTVLKEYLRHKGLLGQPLTVALQGFGNVGFFFAEVLAHDIPELKLVAVSNSKHTWVQPAGISLEPHAAGSSLPRPEYLTSLQDAQLLPPEAIIGVQADILVLAALEDAVHEGNVADLKAGIVVELANGPVTKEAEAELSSRSVVVLPDIVANAGGVTVSCLEWQQNVQGEQWSETDVNDKLADFLIPAAKAMFARAEQKGCSYKQAAFEIALERLLGPVRS